MKLPFTFSLSLFFRLILPGFIVSLALFPAIYSFVGLFDFDIDAENIIIIFTIMCGWFFVVFDMHIYMLLEGRRYWPRLLLNLFLKHESQRLEKINNAYDKAVKDKDGRLYEELSVELRRFPIDEDTGNFVANYPTRLGNLLAAYEQYPKTRYGMDSIFYWNRIWLAIDKDTRAMIDDQAALVDSVVYVTAAFVIDGLIVLVYILLKWLFQFNALYLPNTETLFLLLFILPIIGYFSHHFSLHLHASYGDIFKSVFDIYRDRVSVDEVVDYIAELTKDGSFKNMSAEEKYCAAWMYLHNYRIKTKDGVKLVPEFDK